jgi:hypothetical protein
LIKDTGAGFILILVDIYQIDQKLLEFIVVEYAYLILTKYPIDQHSGPPLSFKAAKVREDDGWPGLSGGH